MGFQLTLGLKLSSKITLQNYASGANRDFIEQLTQNLSSGAPFIQYIWGKKGCGKSHILQGACHELAYKGLQAGYLDLSCVKDLEILKGLEHLKMLALDHYESLSPGAIVHLKRFIAGSWPLRRQILIAGRPPLPDVFQSLEHLEAYEVRDLSDEDLKTFLRIKTEEKGLGISEDVQDLIVKKCAHNPERLMDMLEQIEERCELEKKKLSMKFARLILTEAAEGEEGV